MKLKCIAHKQRIVAFNGVFVHRNGNNDRCTSELATIGSEVFTPQGIRDFGLIRPPRSVR